VPDPIDDLIERRQIQAQARDSSEIVLTQSQGEFTIIVFDDVGIRCESPV
jgi:hypothetical protein